MSVESPKLMSWIHDLRAGGAETSLLLELEQLRDRGFQVSVGIVSHDRTLAPRYEAAGIEVFDLGNGSRWSRGRRLRQILKEQRPDVVEVILFWPNIVVRPLARVMGIKVVTQLANEEYGAVQRRQSRYGALGVYLAQMADLLTSRFANHFRAVAKGVKVTMSKRLLLRESHVSVIHIARDMSNVGRRTDERRAAARLALGVRDDTFVVMTTGRHDAQKNQVVAVKAIAHLAQTRPNTTLLIAGRSGHGTAAIENAIHAAPDSLDVRLLGERSDVYDLLCAADCYVMPSLWEGFSGAVVEAMALELPMVLSDIPSMHEVTEDRAWFFPASDPVACAELLERVAQGEYPQTLVEESRRRAEGELDIHSITSQLETTYRRLMAN